MIRMPSAPFFFFFFLSALVTIWRRCCFNLLKSIIKWRPICWAHSPFCTNAILSLSFCTHTILHFSFRTCYLDKFFLGGRNLFLDYRKVSINICFYKIITKTFDILRRSYGFKVICNKSYRPGNAGPFGDVRE